MCKIQTNMSKIQKQIAHNTFVQNYEQYFVRNRTILCGKQWNKNNTLCNTFGNNPVQNFVHGCVIYEQNLCAILFDYFVVQKSFAMFYKKSAIMILAMMLAIQKNLLPADRDIRSGGISSVIFFRPEDSGRKPAFLV